MKNIYKDDKKAVITHTVYKVPNLFSFMCSVLFAFDFSLVAMASRVSFLNTLSIFSDVFVFTQTYSIDLFHVSNQLG